MADPTMPSDPTAGAGVAPDTEDQGTDQSGGTVLCTILANADGGYTLVQGDEDEGSDQGAAAPSDASGEAMALGAGGDSDQTAPQGPSYDSIGALLKGLLDVLKNYEASASGAGSDQDNFAAGFSGGQVGGGASANPIGQKF